MEIINKVRIKISGVPYTITTPEPEEYVLNLAAEINRSLEDLLSKNASLSLTDGLVLCLLDSADERKKSERNADHIREQLTGYLEDAAKARIEVGELRTEVARLKRELSLAKKDAKENRPAAEQKGTSEEKKQGVPG